MRRGLVTLTLLTVLGCVSSTSCPVETGGAEQNAPVQVLVSDVPQAYYFGDGRLDNEELTLTPDHRFTWSRTDCPEACGTYSGTWQFDKQGVTLRRDRTSP